MNTFALLTDSGTDTPQEVVDAFPVYVVPLQVNYSDGSSFLDGVTITPREVIARFAEEIPTTSLPPFATIMQRIDEIKAAGIKQVLVITLSAKLSGTYDAVKLAAQSYPDMEFAFVDSKNIGLGAGMLCALAAQCMERGFSFEETRLLVEQHVPRTKVFFCLPSLEYLAKGGRIGKVASIIGMKLHIVPVITCNEEGAYVTAGKTRSWEKACRLAVDKALAVVQQSSSYVLALAQSLAEKDVQRMEQAFLAHKPNPQRLFKGGISPALTVHTGPMLVGIGAQSLAGVLAAP